MVVKLIVAMLREQLLVQYLVVYVFFCCYPDCKINYFFDEDKSNPILSVVRCDKDMHHSVRRKAMNYSEYDLTLKSIYIGLIQTSKHNDLS